MSDHPQINLIRRYFFVKQNVRKILKKSGSLMLAAAMIGTGAVTVVPQIAESGITADAASY